jgi:hypothetical protein
LPELFPSLEEVTGRSVLARLRPFEPALVPEARWLGLNPGLVEMEDGPLVVAAFGADPPDRSWQFHLSLLGISDGKLGLPQAPTSLEISSILGALPKLNTRALTFVSGFGVDHGLVFEGRMDLGTTPSAQALEKFFGTSLPDGDGEGVLRKFIDDSVNLLSELEFNRIRVAEGLVPVNVAWPWGGGWRVPVPYLPLARGAVVRVCSSRLRASGLARLVGYGSLWAKPESLFNEPLGSVTKVLVWEPTSTDEAEVLHEARKLDALALAPLIRDTESSGLTVLVAPSEVAEGIALSFDPEKDERQRLPFDSRALEERKLPPFTLESWMEKWLVEASLSESGFGSL